MPERIDSHHHFWRPARGDYGWLRPDLPALAPLVRDVLPAEFEPLLTQHRVAQTVLVQAAPTEAETDFLLGLAQQHRLIAGVVGWVDLARVDSVKTLTRWAADPRLKGVRPMLQDLADTHWIAHAPPPAVVHTMIDLGLRVDALVVPQHLAPLLRFVDRWPGLPVVIDHAAKPQLAAGWNAPWTTLWRLGLAELAQRPNVYCKFSGLLTECAPVARRQAVAMLRPVWDTVLRWFGPQRLMWGSDWPVLTLAAGYGDWVLACETLACELSPEQRTAFWFGNAARFYGLAETAAT